MATSRVQLHRTVGWVEPIDAAAIFPEGLLLDGSGQHPEARFGFLGLHPALEARFQGNELTLTDGSGTRTQRGDPLEMLRQLVHAHKWGLDEAHPFTGGFVGYFGYGFTQAVEPTLNLEPADTPDAVLHLCTDAAVFDRASSTVTLYAADEDGALAESRLDCYEAALAGPVPKPGSVPDVTWHTSLDQAAFEAAVARLRDRILDGDLFQANLATRFEAPMNVDPVDLFRRFQAGNPSPYMALLRYDDDAIVSSSPEQLFAVTEGRIRTRPIAGTRGRGATEQEDLALEAELRRDEKERAEHTMLVDLLRNDIARVSEPGTTRVTEVMSVERYQHVMHLVSCVEGELRPDTDFVDWLAAMFPGGTITGAPKHRACMRIEESEPVPRGPYTGSAGFLSWSHNAHWNILIRTLVLKDGQARVHAGSGIVADSVPSHEWHEAGRKASSLLRSASPRVGAGAVTRYEDWSPPAAPEPVHARVLLVDNYDSFVHNLADYAALCRAEVKVVRNDADLDQVLGAFEPTHVILGPGPGWPEDSGITLELARDVETYPVLGVCLGHQALATVHGGRVFVAPPVHGKTSAVHHDDPLLAHLPGPFTATRYHSLIVEPPAGWHTSAWLADGTLMAMKHPERPVWGLQFHPESFLTQGGLEILRRFLSVR